MNNVASVVSRILNQHTTPSWKGKLLSASCVATSATLLLCTSSPALADCQLIQNSNCSWAGTGSVGSAAPGPGENGGDGGPGPDWSLIVHDLHFVDDPTTLQSPINISSNGGDGAQAADGHLTGGGKNTGGTGGTGGQGGDISAIVGSGMSGTTSSIASGITLDTVGGTGGKGSFGALDHDPGVGGIGGTGGHITANLSGTFPDNLTNRSRGIDTWSFGGNGGDGRHWSAGQDPMAPDAGAGGNGGQIDLTLNGTFVGNAGGVRATSAGGTGGTGGVAEAIGGAQDGDGGSGGVAGKVNVTVNANANIEGFANQDGGLVARSIGGTGGQGGSGGGSAGAAGAGGDADDVNVIINGGTIRNGAGSESAGLLAQSLGGSGGNGGSPSHFVIGPNGGSGSLGGHAGQVSVTTGSQGSSVTIVSGQKGTYEDDYNLSPGVLAQSIGGGGGAGGDSKGWFAVGGTGGNAVNGNNATVDLLANITTYGMNSDGIAVQSIGGGGGNGGNAVGSGVGVNMVIGGDGGAGGDGATAYASSRAGSVIETDGAHSHGIVVQSVGGGGGMGGAAYSKTFSGAFGSSMSLGGDGGTAGDGGNVLLLGTAQDPTPTNAGRITTNGSDSYGILAQSIGGGGGVGGASTAMAQVYGGGDVPSIALTMAMGGKGGAAGSGHTVDVSNTGLITTSGAGSVGIIGQSIGGGGGAGGDASSSATSSKGDYSFAAAFSFGGAGGNAGNGGSTSIANSGFIVTTGESADGMLAQSIGGGGGTGGSGDAKASSSGGKSLTLQAAFGGTATGGGDGGTAQVTNTGSLLTLGDGAFGAAAQSIGGGGGRGGGAAGSTSGTYKLDLNVGAQGGSGGSSHLVDGNGNDITMASVTNAAGATIVTFGADANGIIAQSIAGGGGAGGKAGTNLGTSKSTGDGGNGDSTGTPNTLAALGSAFDKNGADGLSQYEGMNGAISVTNSLLNPSTSNVSAVADEDPDELLDQTAQSKGETEDDNKSTSIHLAVGVGGKGASGGTAGKVDVENYGEVATMGSHSDAILAQSIGGGGGKGGGASTATSADYSGSVAVGGTGGNGGYSDTVIVNNYGNVYTKGSLAAGIVAQSIAGGGGIGGASASSIKSGSKEGDDDGAFQSISVAVGGNGGGGMSSGQARVNNNGPISTAAHDAIGIIAQSISGGGGVVKTLATDQEAAGGSASAKETGYDIQFKFGGSGGDAGGGSGQVNVATTRDGWINTIGDNSYGILAQSIAGGGGLSLGGKPTGSTVGDFFGSGAKSGSVLNDGVNDPTDPKGNSGLFVSVGGNITTAGQGAIGVLAQSIGGGGGLAGNTGATAQISGFTGGNSKNFSGSGGYVDVSVANGAVVTTRGDNAPAMFLQSIGGGGGRVTTDNAAYIGTAGGSGAGGKINVTVNGTVQALGQNSAGIFAQSQGDSTSNSPITITVGQTGLVQAGQNNVPTAQYGLSSGIYVSHGGMDAQHANVVTNNGQVLTYGSNLNSVAVYSSGGYTQVYNNAGATMWGDVLLTNDGGTGCFTNNGTLNAGDKVTVGACPVVNAGTINIGSASAAALGQTTGAGAVGKLTISGDYVQKAGGTLNIGADLKNAQADTLAVTGKATIAGTVNVNAMSVSNKPVTVLTASGGVSVDPQLKQTDNLALFDFPVVASGNQLEIQPTAHFNDAAASLGKSQKAVAGYLQQLFDSGASMDSGLDALAKLSAGTDYAASLRSMSGEALGAFGAFRVNSSRAFANDLYQGCRELTFDPNTRESCSWARVSGGSTDQDARGDTVGYHADEYTLEVGGQVGLSDELALVGSLGSQKSQFRGDDGASRIRGDAALAGLGLNFARGPLELSGAVDSSYGWYRSYRTITVGAESEAANAKPRQWQVGAHVRGAYEIPFAAHNYFKPFVEGHAVRVSNNTFTEDGSSPFRLTVDGRSDTTFLAATGVELGAYIPTHFGAEFHPFVSAAAEFGQDVQWTTTAHFADQPGSQGFDVRTAGPGTVGRFGIGADLVNSKNLSFSLLYSPEVGSGYSSQGGTARISYRF
jgi:hypothetical protein